MREIDHLDRIAGIAGIAGIVEVAAPFPTLAGKGAST
jgi:hypothetical protein